MNQSNSMSFGVAARNAVLKVLAFWVLIVAAYLAIGRQVFPYVERLQPEIEIWLSDQLGTQVDIGQLTGQWVKFNPVIHLTDVKLGDKLKVASMTLAPGLYESVIRGGLSFIRFEVNELHAELIQTETGWQITGLANTQSENVAIDLDAILALVRRQQTVTFSNVVLNVQPMELPAFVLRMESGRLAGYGDENGLVANATLIGNNIEVPIELQAEMSDNALGRNRVYFRHGDIDLSPWLVNLIPNLTQAGIAGEYWIELNGTKWQQATSRLNMSSIELQGRAATIAIQNGKAELFFQSQPNGFASAVNVFEYQLKDQRFGSTQAKINLVNDDLTLQWDSLPADWVTHSLALNDSSEFWRHLSPTGYIEQGLLNWNRSAASDYTLSARVSDLSLQAHQGVPGLSNLNGHLVMENGRGEMTAAATHSVFDLPNIFAQTYTADLHSTRLSWVVAKDKGTLAYGSSKVILQPPPEDQQQGGLPIDVFWRSDGASRASKERGRESSLAVQVAIDEANVYWTKVLASTRAVDPNVGAMISNRLTGGTFRNLRLDYLDSFDLNRIRHPQFFISSDFDNVEASFLSSWHSIQAMNGTLSIDKEALNLVAKAGSYPGFKLENIRLALPFKEKKMNVHVKSQSTFEDALDFLQTGPLRVLYGDQLDQWSGHGEVAMDLSLSVPLADPQSFSIDMRADLHVEQVNLRDLDLQFTDVQGTLGYNDQRKLYADDVVLSHLGLLQQLSLTSDFSSVIPEFTILVTGQTMVNYWGERVSDAYLSQFDIAVHHQTKIVSNGQRVEITSESPLLDVPFDMPAPFNKKAGEPLPMKVAIVLDSRNWITINTKVGDGLTSYLEMNQDRQVQRATVAFGQPLNVRSDNGIYFDIQVDEADGTEWLQAIDNIRQLYLAQEQAGGQNIESLIRAITIKGNRINYLSHLWTQAEVSILRNGDAWLLSFAAEEGQGQVLLPHDPNELLFVEFQWLALTTAQPDIAFDEQIDPLLDYLPSTVPNMNIQINRLIWNDRDFGDWRASLMSEQGKLTATNIVGNMFGARLTGDLQWDATKVPVASQFDGTLEIANIADVLTTWEYPPVLTSRSGRIELHGRWHGSPAFFDFKRLTGSMNVQLNKGAIKETKDYEGVKLIGLLNFTRILQRVALDFSDLMAEGIAYDTITGELLFDRGFARVGEKLLIDGAAIKFRFSGDADLLSNTLDMDMVITVPLSSTFPLVALLAGVSPQAAAAIYVTERVFNNQLEQISSARLHITGSFEEPQTKFYRVFSEGSSNQ